jgi:hypothetical protein
MNILEAILNAQGGGAVNELGRQFGLDGNQTRSALDALLPSLAGALSQNARSAGGLDDLLGALSGGQHTRYLDDPSVLGRAETTQDGNDILGHIFGSKAVSREVAARASGQTGIGVDILKKMLPIVAAMVMGGLARQTSAGGMGSAGSMGSAPSAGFGSGAGAGGGGLLDMLTPMLDQNRNGSPLDDILGMAASFLGRR